MEHVNAISKVRFGSAKPQRVQLSRNGSLQSELICMEPGQQVKTSSSECTYYIIKGSASLTAGDETAKLAAGQLVSIGPDERHILAADGDDRLICISVSLTP